MVEEPTIMTYDAYRLVVHDEPYLYQLTSADSHLLFFGTKHICGPMSEDGWNIWRSIEDFQPDTLLIEGHQPLSCEVSVEQREKYLRDLNLNNFDEALIHGEAGLAILWAKRNSREVFCPEPAFDDQIDALSSNGFSNEEIALFFVLRNVAATLRVSSSATINSALSRACGFFQNYERALGTSVSTQSTLQDAHKLLGCPLEKCKDLLCLFDPSLPLDDNRAAKSNRMGRIVSHVRDQHLIRIIRQRVDASNRLFVLYGSAHAVMVENAVRTLFE